MFVILLDSRSDGMKTTQRICPVGSYGSCEIAGRCAGDRVETEAPGHRRRHRDRPIFEREARVHRVVLDVEVAEAELAAEVVGLQQGRPARLDIDQRLVIHRKQLAVAPYCRWASLDLRARDAGADGVVVIGHLEGAEAELTNVERGEIVHLPALPADQTAHVSQSGSVPLGAIAPWAAQTKNPFPRTIGKGAQSA